jgi:hypothetical protein
MSMTEVEVLLSVDAGRIPPDAVVFSAADPEAPGRRLNAFLAVAAGVATAGCLLTGVARELIFLLAIIAGIFAVLAIPTAADPEEARRKPCTLVVTPRGMIVRDDEGLRTWRFDELAEVLPYLHSNGEGLLLIRRDGRREFLDNRLFRKGEDLVEVIARHLKARTA